MIRVSQASPLRAVLPEYSIPAGTDSEALIPMMGTDDVMARVHTDEIYHAVRRLRDAYPPGHPYFDWAAHYATQAENDRTALVEVGRMRTVADVRISAHALSEDVIRPLAQAFAQHIEQFFTEMTDEGRLLALDHFVPPEEYSSGEERADSLFMYAMGFERMPERGRADLLKWMFSARSTRNRGTPQTSIQTGGSASG
jgi:hypothetical protein